MNSNTKLWLGALRSGAYRQTTQRMRQPGRCFWRKPTFCAVGVLYDLYLEAHGQKWSTQPRRSQLPESALDWAGISRELEQEVVTRNDMGTSFRDIASIIEAHFHRAERKQRWLDAGDIATRIIDEARDSSCKARLPAN